MLMGCCGFASVLRAVLTDSYTAVRLPWRATGWWRYWRVPGTIMRDRAATLTVIDETDATYCAEP
jgi:hypothetical protein